MPASLICVGQLMAPHGLHGYIKVKSFTQEPESLFAFSVLYDAQQQRTFEFEKKLPTLLQGKGQFIVRLKDITSRTQADPLRGTKLFVERAMLPPVQEEETFYHTDLIGLRVVDQEGNDWGYIQGVPNFGAGDLLQVSKGETSLWIPFTKACVPEICLREGFIQINAAHVALFEKGE